MSFRTRSSPLETISEVPIEGIVGDDELYYMTAEIWNPDTEDWDIYDLALAAKMKDPVNFSIGQLGQICCLAHFSLHLCLSVCLLVLCIPLQVIWQY